MNNGRPGSVAKLTPGRPPNPRKGLSVETVSPSAVSPLSSLIPGLDVNENPFAPGDPARRPITLRRFLRLERRIRFSVTPPAPKPVRQPRQAEAVLAILTEHFPPGSVVRREQVAELAKVPRSVAGKIRIWAKANDRWPWVDSKGRIQPSAEWR